MTSRSLSTLIAATAICGGLLIPSEGHAGYIWSGTPYCHTYGDGSGYCGGSMSTARNATTNAYAEFDYTSASGASFASSTQWGSGTCVATSAFPAVLNMWPIAMGYTGYYFITWSASGVCNSLQLNNGSAYTSY